MQNNCQLSRYRDLFEDSLRSVVQGLYSGKSLVDQAASYSLLSGGKRVRPLLVLLVNEMLKGKPASALAPALAVEFVHTYSLIHDDLPICDNDDLRRGKPTAHVAYGEPAALLCGDALLTDCFAILGSQEHLVQLQDDPESSQISDRDRLLMIAELSKAAGFGGMVKGQTIDMRLDDRESHERSLDEIEQLHRLKTGALISAACVMGGLSAGASHSEVQTLRSFGSDVGLAFQIFDDILDDCPNTGKTPGKDLDQKKSTYLSLLGREKSQQRAKDLTAGAIASLEVFGGPSANLISFVKALCYRDR